jgi:hypothetical protein
VAAAPLAAPAPSPAPSTAASVGKALFNLDVEIAPGRKGRIVVCEGASVEGMADAFVLSHGLPPAVLPKLCDLIASSLKLHQQRQQQQQAAAAAAGSGASGQQ